MFESLGSHVVRLQVISVKYHLMPGKGGKPPTECAVMIRGKMKGYCSVVMPKIKSQTSSQPNMLHLRGTIQRSRARPEGEKPE